MEKLQIGDMLGEKEMVLHFTQDPELVGPGGYAFTVHGGDYYVCKVTYNHIEKKWTIDRSWVSGDDYQHAFKMYAQWTRDAWE